MSSTKEIRSQIKSVQSTQKITKAMEMVAASKMRKSQDIMLHSRPYALQICKVIEHLARANFEHKHAYLSARKTNKVGYIIISTDRGLCGGLNINLFKKIIDDAEQKSKSGVEVSLALIGLKAESFFRKSGLKIAANLSHLGDKPKLQDLVGVLKVMLDAYDAVEIDELYLCYNDFVNNMSHQPTIQKLLPIVPVESNNNNNNINNSVDKNYAWDYLYEPNPKALLNLLLVRYLESQIYQSVVENLACEQAARRMAMKAASDNAKELIDKLRLQYNKARQAAITQELSEIVAGAAAIF